MKKKSLVPVINEIETIFRDIALSLQFTAPSLNEFIK